MATTKKTTTGAKKTATKKTAAAKQTAVTKPAAVKKGAPKNAGAKKVTPRKAARRADYDAPIGPWFEQFPPVKRAPLEQLRALIEATVPRAQSGLRWGVPFWTLDGQQLCNLVVLKHEVALGIFLRPPRSSTIRRDSSPARATSTVCSR